VGRDSSPLIIVTAYKQYFRLQVMESPSVLFLITILIMVFCNPFVGLLFVPLWAFICNDSNECDVSKKEKEKRGEVVPRTIAPKATLICCPPSLSSCSSKHAISFTITNQLKLLFNQSHLL